MNPDKVRRLAFIRYMYGVGVQQSRMPEPLSPVSILSFHDAAELFLRLATEHLNILPAKEPGFMEYWKLIPNLTQSQAMQRLNKSRVALKHHGTFPSQLDIEAFRTTATLFFEDNTPTIFGVDFNSISLADFVRPVEASEKLKTAENAIKDDKLDTALLNMRLAFDLMLRDYEEHERKRSGRSPFEFGNSLSSSFMMFRRSSGSFGSDNEQLQRTMSDFVDNVKDSIEAIRGALKVLSFGLDYRRYSRFQYLVPRV